MAGMMMIRGAIIHDLVVERKLPLPKCASNGPIRSAATPAMNIPAVNLVLLLLLLLLGPAARPAPRDVCRCVCPRGGPPRPDEEGAEGGRPE